MSITKVYKVVFIFAMIILVNIPASSDNLQTKPQEKKEDYLLNSTKTSDYLVPISLMRNYILRPVELTIKTVSALTLIPQQRVVCLTLAVTSYKFLLPQELTAKEQVITTVFWVLVDSLEAPVIAEYTGEVKEFGDMMGSIALLQMRILGGVVSAVMDRVPWSSVTDLSSWISDSAIQVFNWFIDLARPFFAQDKLIYKEKGNAFEGVHTVHLSWSTINGTHHGINSTSLQKNSSQSIIAPVKESIKAYIYRPLELTVKTVSALTLIPQQRVVCLTLAVTSYKFLLPQEMNAKEQAITAVFWVLVDSLESPVIAEYTGEVKEFGDMMGRIALLPVRILGGIVSLTSGLTWSVSSRLVQLVFNSMVEWIVQPAFCSMVEWIIEPVVYSMAEWIVPPVYNAVVELLTQSLNMVMFVHSWCWPVISRCYNYLVLPLFVQEGRQSSLVYHLLYAINTILHVTFTVVKVLLLDPLRILVYYSWSDMSLNYAIDYWINRGIDMARYIVIQHWELTTIVCLSCLWIWSIVYLFSPKKKRRKPPTVRQITCDYRG